MKKLSPMMEQYFNIKKECSFCLLFFRMGDFYELFYEDAELVSGELNLVLTGRDCGQDERAPMCGVPYHSAEGYINKLIAKGYKVAICEQVEDPKTAKGIVKREVVRIITPGTIIDGDNLDDKKNNYIASVYETKSGYGFAISDISTGEFKTTEIVCANALAKLIDELAKFDPSEILINEAFTKNKAYVDIKKKLDKLFSPVSNKHFDIHDGEKVLKEHFERLGFDMTDLTSKPLSIGASGALLKYIYEMQKNKLNHINSITYYFCDAYMIVDNFTRKNLELLEIMRDKKRKGSLIWVLDKTKTAMGARLLRKWILQPLIKKQHIDDRLNAVEELKANFILRQEMMSVLGKINDFERVMTKITYGTANGRDLISLKNSIKDFPNIKAQLEIFRSPLLNEIYKHFDTLSDIYKLIDDTINEDSPFSIREGNIIKSGVDSDIDKFRTAKTEGTSWLLELEQKEKDLSGIKNLKIRFNKVFGYYIEITNSNLQNVPERYVRKQTLTNCERFITDELKKLEDTILGAEAQLTEKEYEVFTEIRNKVSGNVLRIQKSANDIALVDVISAFSEVSDIYNYIKPNVTEGETLNIINGRHPVVERLTSDMFIPNDTLLDSMENNILVITGPNMAGKSTYMRQVALITLMAQIGCFVPCDSAEIPITDRIFTRVGASDDLASGYSTFMLEMLEVSHILDNATAKSLLILDEIGRGTSTFDGLSIAWAVIEYIANKKLIGARTLFATHYHELTELEGKVDGVINYCVTVKEEGEDIVFLRKIEKGGASNSFGIQVAKLAGLPNGVIKRANQILKQLNKADITKKTRKIADDTSKNLKDTETQLDFFNEKELRLSQEILAIDVMNLSPIDALQHLFELQKKAKEL